MDKMYTAQAILVIALVTAALRFAPFLVFGRGKSTPRLLVYLGEVSPYAIMGMLVVYCLKDISFSQAGLYLPQLISAAVVVLVHCLKRNSMLSIISGTVCYMLLVQTLFK